MRSLSLKLTLAFLVVGLAGVGRGERGQEHREGHDQSQYSKRPFLHLFLLITSE